MKIKSITLYNIGPYVNLNTFDFSISKDKNIVLIGGKNGAGKTTFFNAIKTCLYGCKVWGFDAPGKEYYSIVNKLVNSKSLYDNSAKAYIEIELYFNDGKQSNVYTLHREWRKIRMTLSEYFNIKKNEELILGQDEDDFVNYMLSIIPPDMFNFYFFDGEAIADFFLGADGDKNFRNAFLKLYGLDTLSIMVDNFNRNIKKSSNQKNGYTAFLDARAVAEQEEGKLNDLKSETTKIENEIDLNQIKLCSLQANYSKQGGIGLSQWKELSSSLLKEENIRDNLNRWLKEVANFYLPFIILEKQLNVLKNELLLAQDNQKRKMILDAFGDSEFRIKLDQFLDTNGGQQLSSSELIVFLRNMLNTSDQTLEFDLSTNQINRIVAQIYEKQNFDKKQIKTALSQLNASLKRSKKLREQIMASSIEGYQDFVAEKEGLEKSISDLSIKLERKKQECEIQQHSYDVALCNLEKARSAYEIVLKNNSIKEISVRAAATFSLVEEKLVLRQSKLLQREFINCFTAIINKNNFIDGIVIDKRINIIPYKYVSVTKRQLSNYRTVNKEFLTLFDDVQLILDMNKLEFEEVESIRLPSPISSPFSQGERQVYIMSIYLALLKTSHKDIPFFIDTPFARIDSEHRSNIVTEFFTKINNQMFILSTDEEIVGEYKNMMKNKISDKFVLQINNYGTTKIINDTYFEE